MAEGYSAIGISEPATEGEEAGRISRISRISVRLIGGASILLILCAAYYESVGTGISTSMTSDPIEGGRERESAAAKLVSMGEGITFLGKNKQARLLDEAISSKKMYAFPYEVDSTMKAADGQSYYSCGVDKTVQVFCCTQVAARKNGEKDMKAVSVKWQTTECQNTEHQGHPVTCCLFSQ